MSDRKTWIDVGKFFAIIAVLIDHTNGLLYSNQDIAYLSYYSVSLFVIIMGINLFHSYNKCDENDIRIKIKYKVLGIVKPYIVATFIYHIVIYKYFNFETYLTQLIQFNASGPLYYVALYIQLLVISPIIWIIINKNTGVDAIKKNFKGIILVTILSYFTTNYSNILEIYGGGSYLEELT